MKKDARDLCVDQLEEKNTEAINYCNLCQKKKVKEKELKEWTNLKIDSLEVD